MSGSAEAQFATTPTAKHATFIRSTHHMLTPPLSLFRPLAAVRSSVQNQRPRRQGFLGDETPLATAA
jgi:hypothetical protein